MSNPDTAARTFLVLGAVLIVALICYTVMAVLGASGLGTMRDVLLGLVSGAVGGYAIARGRNGNGNAKGGK